ncbi:MAG TPA: ATP-binding protein [Acidimicrobiales bacterium]|nr:ATP-binding protein [Acidimicrobiales bacterium]
MKASEPAAAVELMAPVTSPPRPQEGRARSRGRRSAERNGGGRPGRRATGRSSKRHSRRRHLGLRSRVTLTFAVGALALSSVIAVIIFVTARANLINQEFASLRSQAFANALIVESQIRAIPPSVSDYAPGLLASLGPQHSYSVLYDGQWYEPSFDPQLQPPAALEALVLKGRPGEEVYQAGSTTRFAVGTPINGGRAAYVEDFDISSLDRTLHFLLTSLIAVAIATTLGGAIVGRWAAGRALRPLREVAGAARAIAMGQLDTRLETADVADLAVLASSFNRMVDRLQERIDRDARFTSDVSHELRSPLTTLSASLAVLEARVDELPERAKRAVELAGGEVRRFQRMVSDLLEISRLDAGSTDLVIEEASVGELVRRTVAAVASHLDPPPAGEGGDAGDGGPREIPVIVPPEAERCKVLVDKRRFERIIAHLVENADLYAGGATGVVVDTTPTTIRIAVEDEGPGIPRTERERIFERFSRGTSARRRGSGEGTGLGLALVAEHVRLHGGRVWAEGRGETGARLVVELPILSNAGGWR